MAIDKNTKLSEQQEIEILEEFRQNPEHAFRTLFDTYYMPLCMYAVQITDSFSMAEDIVQDFLLFFWEKQAYKSISSNLRNYLFLSIRNNACKELKKHDFLSLEELTGTEIELDILFYDEECLMKEKERMLQEVQKLPPQEMAAIRNVILEDKKYKDAAMDMGISVNTLKTHLSRALKILRKKRFNLLILYF